MANLKDVAKHTGVSASTVSRVLSNKSYVNERTRQKVLDAVRELNYKPNEVAKRLKLGQSDTIALMVPSIENQIFPYIVRGIEDTARKNGFTIILCNTDEDMEVEQKYIQKLCTHLIDGFIVASMRKESNHIRALRKEGFPIVLTGRIYDDEIDAVAIDNEQGAYDATTYLIRTGHRRIVFAMGREELSIYTNRFCGYKKALKENGIAYDESLVIHETEGTNSFYNLTLHMLQKEIRPDAIFASSDPKAFVVMRALHDAGFRIPQDISVMGFDNVEMSALIEPPLSTVNQPLYEIGVLAAQKVIRQIKYKRENGVLPPAFVDILKTDLIVRKSTR